MGPAVLLLTRNSTSNSAVQHAEKPLILLDKRLIVVRPVRLELTRHKTLEPKSSASANSATGADCR